MISSVRGRVLSVGLDHAVIEVGGVGFAVQATPSTLATLRRGEEAGPAAAGPAGGVRSSVVEALVGLGFPAKQAEQAVDGVLLENGGADTSGVLRKALATLGTKR